MDTEPVLSAAAVLTNHQGWPVADRHQLLHGENEIQTLHGHFQAPLEQHNFSLNDCLDEWMSLKIPCASTDQRYLVLHMTLSSWSSCIVLLQFSFAG